MADKNIFKNSKAERRRQRVRKKVSGTAERPRLTVGKSLKNVFAQLIDDEKKVTIIGLSSTSKEMVAVLQDDDSKTAVARKVGLKIAELAKAKGVESVVFDRNRFRYHGRIKALADGARVGGGKF